MPSLSELAVWEFDLQKKERSEIKCINERSSSVVRDHNSKIQL